MTPDFEIIVRRLLHEAHNASHSGEHGSSGNTDAGGSTTGSMPNSSAGGEGGGRQAYEFFAFLLWYLLLVLCCLIPTCCAYRRRRQLEARLNQQHDHFDNMQQQNMVFLNNLTQRQNANDALWQEQRHQLVSKAIEDTTMVVEEKHIEEKRMSDSRPASRLVTIRNEEGDASGRNLGDGSGRNSVLDEETTASLRLPNDAPNGDRVVPAACAICLNAYETQDRVTWSPLSTCQHAFHQDCILTWLANKSECPCCRQDFCFLPSTMRTNNRLTWNRFQPDLRTTTATASLNDLALVVVDASSPAGPLSAAQDQTAVERMEEGLHPSVDAGTSDHATETGTSHVPFPVPPSVSDEGRLETEDLEEVLRPCNHGQGTNDGETPTLETTPATELRSHSALGSINAEPDPNQSEIHTVDGPPVAETRPVPTPLAS